MSPFRKGREEIFVLFLFVSHLEVVRFSKNPSKIGQWDLKNPDTSWEKKTIINEVRNLKSRHFELYHNKICHLTQQVFLPNHKCGQGKVCHRFMSQKPINPVPSRFKKAQLHLLDKI
jgi:hypothetical protein